MLYQSSIVIPHNTSITNPYLSNIRITEGRIARWLVTIPVSSGWSVGVRVLHSDFQLLPLTPGTWVEGGLVHLNIEESILIDNYPYELKVECYNNDPYYDHKILIGCVILRDESLTNMLFNLG